MLDFHKVFSRDYCDLKCCESCERFFDNVHYSMQNLETKIQWIYVREIGRRGI